MAELNDKLITYGNLSTFYDKLQEQGLGGNAIEDVSVLPDAGENKSKLVRLESNHKIYALVVTSETTTDKLPDAQQIDKAYIYTIGDEPSYYKGMYHIIANDGETDAYVWRQEIDGDVWIIITLKNAETITNSDNASDFFAVTGEEIQATINEGTRTITLGDIYDLNSLTDFDFGYERFVIPATYNAPEANQIGNAYLIEGANGYKGIYDGTQVTFIDTDGSGEEVTGYKWVVDGEVDYIATSKPASEIYFDTTDNGDDTYTTAIDVIVWCVYPEDDNNSERSSVSQEPALGEAPIYIPQLNAPDSEQVGNAYIYDITGQHKYYYKGLESLVCTDGTINAPHWIMEGTDGTQENNSLFTTPTANSLYKTTYEYAFGVLNYSPNYSGQDYTIFYDTTNNVWKSTRNRESTEEMLTDSGSAEFLFDDGVNISTVKYQRTDANWQWKKVVTEDEIDSLEARIYALEHPNT